MSIGKRIQHLRKQHQLSQQDLALKIGISRQTIGKWEQDLSLPDIEMLMKMAEVFQVPVTHLMGIQTEENSLSEVYNQIKSVQTNLERSNRKKNIVQGILVVICVISLGLMISMKQQIDKQLRLQNQTISEDYKIENVVSNHLEVNRTKESYTYIDKLETSCKKADFINWQQPVYYEVSLKEYTSNTIVKLHMIDDVQKIDETYELNKKGDGVYVFDGNIPLGNYSSMKIIIQDQDQYRVENLSDGANYQYLDAQILQNIHIYMPKNQLTTFVYTQDFGENLPFEGTFIFKIHNKTERNYSNTYGFNIASDHEYDLAEELPLHEPIYVSMTYVIKKNNTIVTTHTVGVYQSSPTEAIQYAYFVIDQTNQDIIIL